MLSQCKNNTTEVRKRDKKANKGIKVRKKLGKGIKKLRVLASFLIADESSHRFISI